MILSIQQLRIATARKQMTISEVLKLAHVSTLTWQRIRNRANVSVKTAGKLAAVLGVDVTELLANE